METNIIKEAKSRVSEIVEKSKKSSSLKYLAIYENEYREYTVSHIRTGHDTRTEMIAFGPNALSESDVMEIISRHE